MTNSLCDIRKSQQTQRFWSTRFIKDGARIKNRLHRGSMNVFFSLFFVLGAEMVPSHLKTCSENSTTTFFQSKKIPASSFSFYHTFKRMNYCFFVCFFKIIIIIILITIIIMVLVFVLCLSLIHLVFILFPISK